MPNGKKQFDLANSSAAFRSEMDNIFKTRNSGAQGKLHYTWFWLRSMLGVLIGPTYNGLRRLTSTQFNRPYPPVSDMMQLRTQTIIRRKLQMMSVPRKVVTSRLGGLIDRLTIRLLPSNTKRID